MKIRIETSKTLYCEGITCKGNIGLMIVKSKSVVTLDYYKDEIFKSIFKMHMYKKSFYKRKFILEIKGKIFIKEVEKKNENQNRNIKNFILRRNKKWYKTQI